MEQVNKPILIRDLRVEYAKRLINDVVTHIVLITCNVVIKRDGRFYAVPIKRYSEYNEEQNSIQTTMDELDYIISTAERITDEWILIDNPLESNNGRVIAQTEISL